MGIYTTTYLCYGDFKNKLIDKKSIIASMDPIIELHEWMQEYVDLDHLKKLIDIESYENDLFLMEVTTSTYDWPMVESKRYIIVK